MTSHLDESALVDQLPDGLQVGGAPGDVGLWGGGAGGAKGAGLEEVNHLLRKSQEEQG